MKRYWDLSEKERAEIGDAQWETYMAVELMERGIVRSEPPDLEPVANVEVPTRTVYAVEAMDPKYSSLREISSFRFVTIEAAQAFIDLGPLLEGHITWEAIQKPSILPVSVPERMDADTLAAYEEAEAARKRNKELEKQYARDQKRASEATDRLLDDWRDCREKARRVGRIVAVFARYTKLAGDESTALRFMAALQDFSIDEINEAFEWEGLPHRVAEPEDEVEQIAEARGPVAAQCVE